MTTTPRIKCSCFSFQNGVQILIYDVHRLEERLSLCFIGVLQQTCAKFLLQGPALLNDGAGFFGAAQQGAAAVAGVSLADEVASCTRRSMFTETRFAFSLRTSTTSLAVW